MINSDFWQSENHIQGYNCNMCLNDPRRHRLKRCCLESIKCQNCPASILEHDPLTWKCCFGHGRLQIIWPMPLYDTPTHHAAAMIRQDVRKLPPRPG